MAAFRERLAFDVARGELKDADRRYLLVRDDTLMAIFRELPPAGAAGDNPAARGRREGGARRRTASGGDAPA